MYKVAPLKTSFMLASIVMFLFAWLYLWDINRPWGATIGILATIMFIASMVSMAKGPIDMQMPRKPKRIK